MDPINLLLIEEDEKSYYAWIKNIDRLLSSDLMNPKAFCSYCCYGFTKNKMGKKILENTS